MALTNSMLVINGNAVSGGGGGANTDIIAEAFDITKNYTIGDYVIYNDDLYKFTANKSAGAWDSTKVQTAVIANELESKADYSFSNIVVGASTVVADTASDTLNLVAGTRIQITADDTTDSVTISTSANLVSKDRYTITASSWSNSADENGYYTYTITLSPALSTSYPPNVYISGANDNTFPTDTEKTQYTYLDECNLTTTTTLVLYAQTKPDTTFYVYVEGQVTA